MRPVRLSRARAAKVLPGLERGRAVRRALRARKRELLAKRAEIPIEPLELTVPGLPKAQGSLDVFPHRSTGRMIAKHPKGLRTWRALVALEARRAMRGRPLFAGPLELEARFYLPRPRLQRLLEKPEKPPDLDKLMRAIGDALTGIVYLDDGQVTTSTERKRFGTPPRVELRIRADLEP